MAKSIKPAPKNLDELAKQIVFSLKRMQIGDKIGNKKVDPIKFISGEVKKNKV